MGRVSGDRGATADRGTVTLARTRGRGGDLALRRRGDVVELVVDGVFAMDTTDTSTERALATLALDRLARRRAAPGPPWAVAVGGLGLGCTTAALLADPRVGRVDVVELEPDLVAWVRQGRVAAGLLDDPRVRVHVGDVLTVVPALPPASLDAVLLDVDNGPAFLVHEGNAAVYRAAFLTAAASRLRGGGVLAVWSADPSSELRATLTACLGEAEEVLLDVTRDGRTLRYAVYLAGARPAPAGRRRPGPGPPGRRLA
jgi:spermidine synthase